MLNNLANLYQELILEHSRNPQNMGEISCPPAYERVGANPLCGDKLVAYMQIEDDHIIAIKYKGEGCSIFMSACSMLSGILKGKTTTQAKEYLKRFFALITLSEDSMCDEDKKALGKLVIFENIRSYPARVKCAALFARTIESLLNDPSAETTITSDDD